MLVRDVMTTDVVTVDVDADLATAAEDMVRAGIGSVLVTRDGTPTGIVTETDALAAGSVASVPFADIPVASVMSSPLETIQPDRSVRAAVERMAEENVKKLPVFDGMDLHGLVTRTDIVLNHHAIIREAHRIDDQRDAWESERLDSGDLAEVLRREE
jgi:CBS domain-containing protein